MVKKREREIKQEDVEMQDSSDSSSEEEQRPMREYSYSSSDEEQEQQQQQVEEASDSSSDEEEQQPMEVEDDDSSSDEEQQQQHVEEASESSSEGEEQQPMEVEETVSSSDEEQQEQQVEEANDSSSEEEQEQPMEVEESDSSSEEEQTVKVEMEEKEEESGSSSEEEQTMEVDESEAESDHEVESEQEELESEEEEVKEEVKEEVMEENEDADESETDEEETEKKSESEAEEEQEEVHAQSSSSESEEQQEVSSSESEEEEKEEEQEQASSSESEEEQPKTEMKKQKPVKVLTPMEVADPRAEMKKRKPVKVMTPMEASEPKKKKMKTTHEPEQNEDAGVEGSSLQAALRSMPREKLQELLIIAAKKHDDVLARVKAAAGSDQSPHKVFVGGLSWTTSSKSLNRALSAFGEVENGFVVKNKLTGKSRGFGFVTFVKAEAAQRAAEKKTFEIDGSIVECKCVAERASDQNLSSKADEKERKGADEVDTDLQQRKVFVGGLSQTTSAVDLKMALSVFGNVKHATVNHDKLTGRSRGFGFVTFVEAEAAQRAAEKKTFEIDGSIVECKCATDRESDQNLSSKADEKERKGADEVGTNLQQRKVFVGGLSQTTSAVDLKMALSVFGKVEFATVRQDKYTGKSCGFVTFVEVEAAQHAVDQETLEIDGQMVECKYNSEMNQKLPPKDTLDERKLRVRFDTELENPLASLRSMLQEFGIVEKISLLRNRETGKLTGVAFILYSSESAVERALETPTKMMPNGTAVTCSAWNPKRNSRADFDGDELKVRWRLSSGLENLETPLYNLFKEFGEVKIVLAHRDRDNKGRSGIVIFVEKTGAENALKDPVQKLDDGRVVKCKPMRLAPTTAEERQIAVQFGQGLQNPQTNLHKTFAKCGEIEKVDVPCDDVTDTIKGIAFVTFREKVAVERALKKPLKMLKKYGEIRCFPNDKSGIEAAWRAVEESKQCPEELNDPATPEEEQRTIFVRFRYQSLMTMASVKRKLLKSFGEVGTMEEIVVPCDRVTGTVRGVASIKFATCAGAEKALEVQTEMAGQIILCFPSKKLAQDDENAAE